MYDVCKSIMYYVLSFLSQGVHMHQRPANLKQKNWETKKTRGFQATNVVKILSSGVCELLSL